MFRSLTNLLKPRIRKKRRNPFSKTRGRYYVSAHLVKSRLIKIFDDFYSNLSALPSLISFVSLLFPRLLLFLSLPSSSLRSFHFPQVKEETATFIEPLYRINLLGDERREISWRGKGLSFPFDIVCRAINYIGRWELMPFFPCHPFVIKDATAIPVKNRVTSRSSSVQIFYPAERRKIGRSFGENEKSIVRNYSPFP